MESQSGHQNLSSRLFTRWKEILKTILALALIGFVITRTNFQQIVSLKDYISWPWLWLALGLYCLMTVFKGLQYWLLLNAKIPYWQVLKIVVIQNALTNLVGTSVGIASYLTMFRLEQNVKLSRSGIIFIITKAGDVLAMGFFLFVSAWMTWGRVGPLHQVVVILLVCIAAGLAVFWTAAILRQEFILQIQRFLRWLRLDRIALVENGLNALRSLAEQEHRTVMRALEAGLALSLGYMTITMIYFFARIQIFQIPIDFWPVIFIAAAMQLISLVPIQIFGGLGVTEFSSIYLFDLFGVTQVDIPAILIGLRVLFYLFNLAVLTFIPLETLVGKLRQIHPPRRRKS